MKTAQLLPLVLSLTLAGCAQNKYGVPIHTKPDLAGIAGKPWQGSRRSGWVRSFPVYVGKWVNYGANADREIASSISRLGSGVGIPRAYTPDLKKMLPPAKFAGAQIWMFEWDLPNDSVNNGFYSVVAVKNGTVVGYYEESADKWTKHQDAHEHFKKASAEENRRMSMAWDRRLRTTWRQLTGQWPH